MRSNLGSPERPPRETEETRRGAIKMKDTKKKKEESAEQKKYNELWMSQLMKLKE